MSKVEVNQISSQCGSTLTIGQSGDTVTLAAGATQTGFGRTGTVDWDTTAKTASFTAVSGNGYFVNTTSAAVTMTLPASPSAGDTVAIVDYAGTFGTNAVTIASNGSNIQGAAGNGTVETNVLKRQNFVEDAIRYQNAGVEVNQVYGMFPPYSAAEEKKLFTGPELPEMKFLDQTFNLSQYEVQSYDPNGDRLAIEMLSPYQFGTNTSQNWMTEPTSILYSVVP